MFLIGNQVKHIGFELFDSSALHTITIADSSGFQRVYKADVGDDLDFNEDFVVIFNYKNNKNKSYVFSVSAFELVDKLEAHIGSSFSTFKLSSTDSPSVHVMEAIYCENSFTAVRGKKITDHFVSQVKAFLVDSGVSGSLLNGVIPVEISPIIPSWFV
jgi:hypothetical protein